MGNVRSEVLALDARGPLPLESSAVAEGDLEAWTADLNKLFEGPPPNADELDRLFRLFPDEGDLSFGLAWALLHFVERAEDVAFATSFVHGLPQTVPTAREWMETFTIRQLNVERYRDLLVAVGAASPPEARELLRELLLGIASEPGDAVAEHAMAAAARLG